MHEFGELRVLGVINIVPYPKALCNYIICNVPINPHKTRRRFRVPFPMYAFDNPGTKQQGGEKDQHEYTLFCSEFCIQPIYIYHSLTLHLQTDQACTACPVESEFQDRTPETNHKGSHGCCHILECFRRARGGCLGGPWMWESITICVGSTYAKTWNEQMSKCPNSLGYPSVLTPSSRECISRMGDVTATEVVRLNRYVICDVISCIVTV